MVAVDWGVMMLYFGIVIAIGAHFARQQKDPRDYFLGRNELPWWAIMLSIVATETSALTVISIPGVAAQGDLTFLQVPMGYVIGRIGVAGLLLPGYFDGRYDTAYARLEHRFGSNVRRMASALFMMIRALGDSVRVFATAIPLSIVTGWPIWVSIAVVATVTVLYTWSGGLKAVVWVDVLQMFVYVVGGVATIIVAAKLVGLGDAMSAAGAAGKLRMFDFRLSLTIPYTFAAGLLGGALLSAASHGTDHLIVQRLLAGRSLAEARKALIGSGVLVVLQFALFLFVGTMIWSTGVEVAGVRGDEIYASFIVNRLPPGVSGLVIAGLLAAAMSTVSSSLNSLSSATTHDFYAPLAGVTEPDRLLRFGRIATVIWAIVLAAGALSFRSNDQPVVVLALSVASITYGALLATFVLASLKRTIASAPASVGLIVGTVTMYVVVLVKPGVLAHLAWPWYVPLGTLITLAAALLSQLAIRWRRD